MRVDAYRNLNKPGVQFSIRHKGKVIEYRERVVLRGVTMKHASEKQLDQVRTGARQVCQWLKGEWKDGDAGDGAGIVLRRMGADPKRFDGFVDELTGERIDFATVVVLDVTGAWYA